MGEASFSSHQPSHPLHSILFRQPPPSPRHRVPPASPPWRVSSESHPYDATPVSPHTIYRTLPSLKLPPIKLRLETDTTRIGDFGHDLSPISSALPSISPTESNANAPRSLPSLKSLNLDRPASFASPTKFAQYPYSEWADHQEDPAYGLADYYPRRSPIPLPDGVKSPEQAKFVKAASSLHSHFDPSVYNEPTANHFLLPPGPPPTLAYRPHPGTERLPQALRRASIGGPHAGDTIHTISASGHRHPGPSLSDRPYAYERPNIPRESGVSKPFNPLRRASLSSQEHHGGLASRAYSQPSSDSDTPPSPSLPYDRFKLPPLSDRHRRELDRLSTTDLASMTPIHPIHRVGGSRGEGGRVDPDSQKAITDRPFACPGCHRTFARRYDRNRHARRHTGEKPYQCRNPDCGELFCRPDALQRHYKARPQCQTFKVRTSRRGTLDSRSSSGPSDSGDEVLDALF